MRSVYAFYVATNAFAVIKITEIIMSKEEQQQQKQKQKRNLSDVQLYMRWDPFRL